MPLPCEEVTQRVAVFGVYADHFAELHLRSAASDIMMQLLSLHLRGLDLALSVAEMARRIGRSERCVQVNMRRLASPRYDKEGKEQLRPALISVIEQTRDDGGSAPNRYDISLLLLYLSMYAVPVKPPVSTALLTEPVVSLPLAPQVPQNGNVTLPQSIEQAITALSVEFGDSSLSMSLGEVKKVYGLALSKGFAESSFLLRIEGARDVTRYEMKRKKIKRAMPYFLKTLLGDIEKYAAGASDVLVVDFDPAVRVKHLGDVRYLVDGVELDYFPELPQPYVCLCAEAKRFFNSNCDHVQLFKQWQAQAAPLPV